MKLLVTLGALVFSGFIAATPIHHVVVFGDSLSDNGNFYKDMQSPKFPFYLGRYSNGPVWVEHLVAAYFPVNPNGHLFNHAYAGAGVDEEDFVSGDNLSMTFKGQVTQYLSQDFDKVPIKDSLFIVWIGANNYIGNPPEFERMNTLRAVNEGIHLNLQRLADKGAEHILILNLPDLGMAPFARKSSAIDAASISLYSKQHNRALDETVSYFKQNHPYVDLLYIDMYQLFDDVLKNPAKYDLKNVTSNCYVPPPPPKKPGLNGMADTIQGDKRVYENDCKHSFFYDEVHPTVVAHKLVAEKIKILLDAAGFQISD